MRRVLVTGASSGIGEATAARLSSRGWHVYACVRRVGEAPAGTEEVLLDVTDAAAVESLRTVERLDGLVNNAGIAVAGPLELLSLDDIRRQLEVNVTGQLAVTQALLPALREARGRIVFVGSIAGQSALPFLGAYAISKFALEAMTDALRLELAPEGVGVSIVQPGSIATPIWTKTDLSAEIPERYRTRLERFRALAAGRAARALPPDAVAAVIERALTAGRPRTRYLIGDARRRALIEKLPDRLRDRVIGRAYGGGSAS